MLFSAAVSLVSFEIKPAITPKGWSGIWAREVSSKIWIIGIQIFWVSAGLFRPFRARFLGRVHMIYMDVFGLLKAPHGKGHIGLGNSRIIGAGEGEIRFLSIPQILLSSYPRVFTSLQRRLFYCNIDRNNLSFAQISFSRVGFLGNSTRVGFTRFFQKWGSHF